MAITCDRSSLLRALRIEAGCHFLLGLGLVALLAGMASGLYALSRGYLVQSAGVFAVMVALLFVILPAHLPRRRFGPANRVTLVRAVMVALLAGLVGQPGETLASHAWPIAAVALGAAALDGVDGWVARRSGSDSSFGARFDMELDAAFILVLAILAWQMGKAGIWVLASGALRYLFLAGQLLWPALSRPLPPSRRRQTVCALQTLALVAALAQALEVGASTLVAGAGLALLALSFWIDTAWLLTQAKERGERPCS